MGLTTFRQVLAAAMAGAVVGFFLLSIFDLLELFPPVVPWSVPAVVAVMGVGCWIYSWGLSRRINEREVPGIEAVRALVVAKSAVMTGAVLAGMHAVYIARWVGNMQAQAPASRVLLGAITVITSLFLAWAGNRLEKACVSPDGDPHDGDEREDDDTPES